MNLTYRPRHRSRSSSWWLLLVLPILLTALVWIVGMTFLVGVLWWQLTTPLIAVLWWSAMVLTVPVALMGRWANNE